MRPITVRQLAFVMLWLGSVVVSAAAASAPCGGDFSTWLEGVKKEAAAQDKRQLSNGDRSHALWLPAPNP